MKIFVGPHSEACGNLSTWTRDQTCAPSSGSSEPYPLDLQGSPKGSEDAVLFPTYHIQMLVSYNSEGFLQAPLDLREGNGTPLQYSYLENPMVR